MRAGKGRSEVYLNDWRREIATCGDDLNAEVEARVDLLERRYTDDDLLELIRAHGTPLQPV